MQNFEQIKHSLHGEIGKLSKGIEEISVGIKDIYYGNPLLKFHLQESNISDMEFLFLGLKTNLTMISRSKMKCAFFGKTSNGKSAVINAMLGEEVLPSCCGRTTSCFITVEGCNEVNGYFFDKDERRRNIRELEDVASEYDENAQGIDSEIRLFWPTTRCRLLQYEVQLLDSPGCDVSFNKDSWIAKYCLDADVFVYVVDASSTPCNSEREFFRKVKQKIGNPNLFFLLNKWDLCRDNSNAMGIKQQHLETLNQFLRQDMGANYNAERRAFFVSATENLHDHTQEFGRFVTELTTEMTQKAIVTKFKQHTIRGLEVINSVINLLDTIINFEKTQTSKKKNAKISIDTVIKNSFEGTKTASLNEMKSKCQQFCCNLTTKIKNNSSTIDGITTFIESLFKKLFDNLKKSVDDILPKIIDTLKSFSNVKVDNASMAYYMPRSFKELMSKCERKFQRNEVNSEIVNAYNELNNYLCPTQSNDVVRYTDTFLDFGIHGLKAFFAPIVNMVTNIADSVTGTNRQSDLENALRQKITAYLTETIENIITTTQTKIKDRVGLLSDIFFKDCKEIKVLTTTVTTLRNELNEISDEIELVKVRIESLEN